MTVTQLLAEICSRAGEGYQNYTERAAAIFKSAVVSMIYSGQIKEREAPGLLRSGQITIAGGDSNFNVQLLLTEAGFEEGVIKDLTYTDSEATYQMEQITINEHKVYALNPNIANSKNEVAFYKLNGNSTYAKIEFVMPDAFDDGAVFDFSILGWSDEYITPEIVDEVDVSSIGTVFSPQLLDALITTSSSLLLKEIMT